MLSLHDILVGFAWSKDLESYASGNVATGMASHSAEVKVDEPDENGYSGLRGWRLGMKLTPSAHKKR
jgi:hypothetical protein